MKERFIINFLIDYATYCFPHFEFVIFTIFHYVNFKENVLKILMCNNLAIMRLQKILLLSLHLLNGFLLYPIDLCQIIYQDKQEITFKFRIIPENTLDS